MNVRELIGMVDLKPLQHLSNTDLIKLSIASVAFLLHDDIIDRFGVDFTRQQKMEFFLNALTCSIYAHLLLFKRGHVRVYVETQFDKSLFSSYDARLSLLKDLMDLYHIRDTSLFYSSLKEATEKVFLVSHSLGISRQVLLALVHYRFVLDDDERDKIRKHLFTSYPHKSPLQIYSTLGFYCEEGLVEEGLLFRSLVFQGS